MKKKLVIILISVMLVIAAFARCCVPRFPARVILDYRLFKNKYVTVANYIESLGWEEYGMDSNGQMYTFGFWDFEGGELDASLPEEYRDMMIPNASKHVKSAVRFLFCALNYESVHRTSVSGNTIVFTTKANFLDWSYYYEGVCYVIDGGEPTPETNYDHLTEYLQPLGDNWYYWNGHCYFAP